MKKNIHRISALLITFTMLSQSLYSQENSYGDYPIQGVPFNEVQLSDKFWSPRLVQNQEVTIPIALKQCWDTGRVANFQKAAAILQGKNIGWFATEYTFDDTDIYKILEGMSYSYQANPNPSLMEEMDELIDIVAAAQEPDGYLYTARTAGQPGRLHGWVGPKRWEWDPNLSHELYNSGHLFEAATAHYQATGKRTLLDVACKNADLLVKEFLNGGLAYEPGHQIVEMGLVKMYRATGKEDYLKLAKYFLDIRGVNGPGSLHTEYCQSHMPPKDQREAVGHAVRAVYMYSGMADVAAIMNDKSYLDAIDNLWKNVVEQKYYITGGIGARHNGEAFGNNYELPNLTAYNETCAAIANVYWNWRMFLLHGDSKYYDVIERTLYNVVLSGISLSGDHFFYPNPLESFGSYSRSEWFGCACCPSNLCRFIASVPGYVYAHKDNNIYVNLFIQGSASIQMDGDNSVRLTQKTGYPWDGHIEIQMDEPGSTFKDLSLRIRVPGWAEGNPVPGNLYHYAQADKNFKPELRLNGEPIEYTMEQGYMVVSRKWQTGDLLSFDLPMTTKRVLADQRVQDDNGKVALERGPIVYCLEWPDNNRQVHNAIISDEAEIEVEDDSTTFSTTGNFIKSLKVNGERVIYNEEGIRTTEHHQYKLIPYYTWANRGQGEMEVWVPRTADLATVNTDSVAQTDTLVYEIGETAATAAGQYPRYNVTADIASIARSLGVTTWQLSSLFGSEITYAAVEPNGYINTVSTAGEPGHWFAADGSVTYWSDPATTTNTDNRATIFSELNSSNYTFAVGQYPQICKNGDVYHIRQALTRIPSEGAPRRVVICFNVHICDAKECYEYATTLANQYLNSNDYKTIDTALRDALETAIQTKPSTTATYLTATENIYKAITDFVNAKPSQDIQDATLEPIEMICADTPSNNGDWTPTYYELDITSIATSLGISENEITTLYGTSLVMAAQREEGGLISTDTNAGADNNYGYWLTSAGYYTPWGNNARFYYIYDSKNGRIGLGQNGNSPLKAGTELETTIMLCLTLDSGTRQLLQPIHVVYKIMSEKDLVGIGEIHLEKSAQGVWYNLQGMRVASPSKGIYIHNGKKYLF